MAPTKPKSGDKPAAKKDEKKKPASAPAGGSAGAGSSSKTPAPAPKAAAKVPSGPAAGSSKPAEKSLLVPRLQSLLLQRKQPKHLPLPPKLNTTSAQKPTTAKATKAAKGAAKPAAKPAAKAAGAKKPATKAAGGKAAPGKAKTAQKTVVTKVKRNVPVKQQPKGAGKKVPTTRRCSCCKGKENPKKGKL
nr:unnamed protein product [Callosobruchus analis]